MASPGFEALARFRRREGLPAAGSPADRATAARLDVGGRSFYGRSASGAAVTLAPLNPVSRTHAEAHAFQQAKDAGVAARTGVLYVDRDFCPSCGKSGGVGSMMRSAGVEKLLAITPSGSFRITADRPSSPQPLPLASAEAQAMLRAEAGAQAAVRASRGWRGQVRRVVNQVGKASRVAAREPVPPSPPQVQPAPKPAAPPKPAAKPKPAVTATNPKVPKGMTESQFAAQQVMRWHGRAGKSISRPGVDEGPEMSAAAKRAAQARATESKQRTPKPPGRK